MCFSVWFFSSLLNQEAETKARNMEEEIFRLQTRLEERNGQLQASASAAEKVPPTSQFLNFVISFAD